MPQYKICFLGYKQLTSIAQQVVPTLPFDDCEIQIVDCLPDTLPGIVDGMMAKGFEVFIAGRSNAAAFSRHSQAHLQEIFVREIDYLVALKKASALGGSIAIAWYRLSREVNLDLLTKLRARIPGLVLRTSLITGLPGEGEAELEELCVFLRE